jgi:hypothetical protein
VAVTTFLISFLLGHLNGDCAGFHVTESGRAENPRSGRILQQHAVFIAKFHLKNPDSFRPSNSANTKRWRNWLFCFFHLQPFFQICPLKLFGCRF